MTTKKNNPDDLTEFRCEMQGDELHLWIHGTIGGFFDGVTIEDIRNEMKGHENVQKIVAHIHSRGGSGYDGFAIYNLLKSHKADVEIIVEGLAASAASVIMLAGDTVRIHENSLVMIHKASSGVYGNAEELRDTADFLDKIDAQLLLVYEAKTGNSTDQLNTWLEKDTFFTAAEAVENGFADEIIPNKTKAKPSSETKAEAVREISNLNRRYEVSQSLIKELNLMVEKPEPQKTTEPEALTLEVLQKENPELLNSIVDHVKSSLADESKKTIKDAEAKAKEEGIAAETKRQAEIRALCATAGMAEKADAFCKEAKITIETVRESLFDALCQKNLAPQNPPPGDGDKSDPEAELKKEYQENKEVFAEMGLSEEEYIESRKLDVA